MKKPVAQDKLYASPLGEVTDFIFDKNVVDVFPDMINRSVPGYSSIINMTGILAARYAQPQTRIYDLGCSLGAATLSMRHHVKTENCEIIAVDNAEAMVERFEKILQRDTAALPVRVQWADICDVEIQNASVVVMNFTLQFIELSERENILKKIFAGLTDGGCLVLAEKIAFDEEDENQLQINWHHDFKKANGYSELEIAQKRTALENVLIPETQHTHITRLKHIGFKQVNQWFQCFNFVSFVAIK